MRLLPALLIAAFPTFAFAAGSDDTEPPKPTETTTECKDGQVYDEKLKECVEPKSGSLNDDQRYNAVRELAWAGQYEDAMVVLSSMTEGDTDRVMTYKGFILRKSGNIEEGIAAYEGALTKNPGNILTHSYYGQLLVEMKKLDAARTHLDAIRANGGTGTWAEVSLARAIKEGRTYSY